MIATAFAIQDATKEAVFNKSTVMLAKDLFDRMQYMDKNQFAQAIYNYSGHLASLTATLVTHVCFTETQLDEMINTIKEMESMGKDINNE
jgi:hypothetical protein